VSSLPIELTAGGAAAAELLRRAGAPEPGCRDELREAEAQLRAPWRRFAQWLPADGLAADLERRSAQLAGQIRADGVTHNVYGAEGGSTRPWSLELLPMMVEPADWAAIERGAVQRARLLDALLADVYGGQRLLHDGLLPPSLLFRHPGYLRPLQGVAPPGGLRLHIVAFDLARGPDGAWWVIAQHTQSPSGLGYVLHNRLLVSRQFPDAFREMHVQHIASSLRRLLDTVESLAADVSQGEAPRVALLTPGPYNETYFEHAYLARYLGLPLVEGGDLTVRGDRVYLKTVEGLEPVHALLRRLDDDFCDPLELRPDSTLGVPGLLQAVRAGHVVMANALGSAFLESPALQGFLPAIAQRLLGEALALPSLPTWWCGEAAAWQAVRGELGAKAWQPTFPRDDRQPLAPPAAAAQVDDDPDAWTLQGRLRFARTPLWQGGALLPRPAVLRVYAIADAQRRWHLLPGGMTRVAAGDGASVSMQRGGSSLDTWVLTDGPVDTFSMLAHKLSVDDIAARRNPVSSRTAENLFWLGRYTERTEHLVRLARATLALIDADDDAPPAVLEAVSALAVRGGLVPAGTPALVRSPQVFERSLLAALADTDGATSIAFNLRALARAAGVLRERLSPEHWGLVRGMGEGFALARRRPPSTGEVLDALDRLAVQLAAVTGAQSDRMTRDHGWRLLTAGRFVERLIGTASQFGALLDHGALAAGTGVDLLLELFDSTITFRARYQRHQELLPLADLLVLDDSNPRAFACILRRLRTELRKLPGTSHDDLLARLPQQGTGLSLDELRGLDDAALAHRLSALCARLAEAGARLSDDIGRRFFAHADRDVLQRV
jgi:uncharacterized circularly permuted ATP-grasp superfamily protein/uncharacterized alpha-E superfamily protein